MSNRREKRTEMLDLGGNSRTYTGYLPPRSVQGHFGVIRCTCLRILCSGALPISAGLGWNTEWLYGETNGNGFEFVLKQTPQKQYI